MTSKKSSRLGTQMRGRLAQPYSERGHHKSTLSFVYSIKAKQDFVLRSFPEYLHYLHAESDPSVKNISYTPKECKASVLGKELVALIDAEVLLVDGRTQWREIKSKLAVEQGVGNRAHLQKLIQEVAAHEADVDYVQLTEDDFLAQPHRLRNWHRAIPWIEQVRDWPLQQEGDAILKLLKQRRDISYGELSDRLIDHHGSAVAALYIAATFNLLATGRIASTLDVSPWTRSSRFWCNE